MFASLYAKLGLGLALVGLLAFGLWKVYDKGYDAGVNAENVRWTGLVEQARAANEQQLKERNETSEAIAESWRNSLEKEWARIEIQADFSTEVIHEGFRAYPVDADCVLPPSVQTEFGEAASRINALSGELRGEKRTPDPE
jgi:hypothetical protein